MENRKTELAKNTVIILIGKICTLFVNFIMLPVYTSVLKPEEYGIADLINAYVILLVPIVSLQLDLALFRFVLEERENADNQRRIVTNALWGNLLVSLLYVLIYFGFSRWIDLRYKEYLLIIVVLNVFSSLFLQFTRGTGRNTVYAFGSFMASFVTVAMNVLFIAIIRTGGVGILWAAIIGQIVLILYLFFSQRIWSYISIKCIDFDLLREMLKYSLPLIPANLSWWIINASDRTIISWFYGIKWNGIYTVAMKFPSLISVLYSVFNLAWTEMVVLHINDSDRDRFMTDMIDKLFNGFFSVCAITLSVISLIFTWFINAQYGDGYPLIPILILGTFFSIICGLFSVFFIAFKDTKESARTAIFASIINLSVDLFLIKYIGLYAAALSTLVAFLAMAIYRYINVRKYVDVRISSRSVIRSSLIALMILAAYYCDYMYLRILVSLIVVAYAVYINKGIIKEGISFIRNYLSKLKT